MVGARAKSHDPSTLRPSTTKAVGTGKKSILFSIEEQKAIQEARKVSDYGDKIASGNKGKMMMKPKLATKTKLKKPVTTNKPKVASVFDEGNQIVGKKVSSNGGSGNFPLISGQILEDLAPCWFWSRVVLPLAVIMICRWQPTLNMVLLLTALGFLKSLDYKDSASRLQWAFRISSDVIFQRLDLRYASFVDGVIEYLWRFPGSGARSFD